MVLLIVAGIKRMGCLDGRNALITGASRGLGAEVAFLFAQNGAHVIAVSRSNDGLSELKSRVEDNGGDINIEALDISDPTAVGDLADRVSNKWGRLDILVGNAAVHGAEMPLPEVSLEDWRQTFATNVDANWHLIRNFDALLKASEAGRAIFVTSRASVLKIPNVGPYCASKGALDAMVRSYAAELSGTDVRVNLIDPGPIRTRMRAEAVPGEDPSKVLAPSVVAPLFVKMAKSTYLRNGKTVRFMEIGLRKKLLQLASDIKHGRL
jgi:NAD(P)-dependent dehydrogenase (short-subunit alcohol dehydrogenase family)